MDEYYIVEDLDNFPNTIPFGTSFLRFHDRLLMNKSSAELAQVFAAIPASVAQLDLSYNGLGEKRSGAELAQAFAAIPTSVTQLYLSSNALGEKNGAELAQVFAAIPASVAQLDLSYNGLGEKRSGAELAQAFAAIPASVTHLNLSVNELWKKSGAELAQAFAAIHISITQLNLSDNNLQWKKKGAELAEAFAAIPFSVTQLDLSSKTLEVKSAGVLVQSLTAIPASVTYINLDGNDIFIGKTPKERDTLIDKLQSINPHGRLGLENNGEKTWIRASVLLIAMKSQGAFNQRDIPLEIINELAYWLGAPNKHFFNENKLRKFTPQLPATENVSSVEIQTSKLDKAHCSFLSSQQKQQMPVAEAVALPSQERPKRGRVFIEEVVEQEMDRSENTKRFRR